MYLHRSSYNNGKKNWKYNNDYEDEIDWRDLSDNGGESRRENAANYFYSINIKDNEIIGFGQT